MGPDLWELFEDGAASDEIAALIRLGHVSAVPRGVRVITQFGDIVSVRLNRGNLPAVSAAPEVANMVAGDSFLGPDLEVENESDAAEKLPPDSMVDSDVRRPPGETATGRGVVIGIVDWGFDFAHPDFRNPDGTTRILALWDQRGGRRAGSPQPYGYGVLHDQAAINHALKTPDPYKTLGYHPADADTGRGSHGTHVASIAGGSGAADRPAGIAPKAMFVLVHNAPFDEPTPAQRRKLGQSFTVFEGVGLIASIAAGRPWVINLSMGRHGEQHDGSTLVEQGLDAAVRSDPARAICMSAGNYFDKRVHASGHLRPTQQRTFRWAVNQRKPSDYNEMEIWYSWEDKFEVTFKSPDGKITAHAKLGERAKLMVDGKEIGNVYHRGRDPDTLDNHINVFLYKEAPAGEWELTLFGSDVIDGKYHAWIEREVDCPSCQSHFHADDADPHSTTGTICNGRRTIAVGAYDHHDPDQRVARFSSVGPTRDRRLKPDLCAPGVNVLAARSAPRVGTDTAPHLTRMSGTSMAAPHVTGTVALMFEVAPRALRIEEVHNLLLGSTHRPSVKEAIPDRIGIGYLDVEQALRATRRLDDARTPFKEITVTAPQSEGAEENPPGVVGPCPIGPIVQKQLTLHTQDPAVRDLQKRLNLVHARLIKAGQPGLNGCPLRPDCVFGPLTQKAVIDFQQRALDPPLPPDQLGTVDSRTWEALISVTPEIPAPPLPAPPTPPPAPIPPGPIFPPPIIPTPRFPGLPPIDIPPLPPIPIPTVPPPQPFPPPGPPIFPPFPAPFPSPFPSGPLFPPGPFFSNTEGEAVPETAMPAPAPGPCPDVPAPHRRLARGSQDPAVREVQRKLNLIHVLELAAGRAGLPGCPLTPDCIFGAQTEKAVRAFQQRVFPGQPKEYDGIVGPKTWAQLDLITPAPPLPPFPPGPIPPLPIPPIPPTPNLLGFDTNPRSWFLTDQEIVAARGGIEMSRSFGAFSSNNLVQPLIDGQSMMKALHDDLVPAGKGDFFHITAWRLDVTQDLIPSGGGSKSPSRFDNLVRSAAKRGLMARALIWQAGAAAGSPWGALSVAAGVKDNTLAALFFDSVGGRGIVDGRFPAIGSHHQKTAIILRNNEAVAYCGGIDVAPDRWDTQKHDSDPRRTPEKWPGGWHDVHVRMRGPAVLDIEANFRDRWNATNWPALKPVPVLPPKKIKDPMPPVASSPGTHHVQVLRTFACAHKHYPDFAPSGEFTCFAGYLKAIAHATNYIYIEEQYLVSDEIALALQAALDTIKKLIILVPKDTDGFPQSAFDWHQTKFLDTVRKRHPDKVHIFHPVQPKTSTPIYVHAKLMIIDDVYAVIGSPNINRRGTFHDTEIAAAVVDAEVVDGVCRYARDLRRQLWAEHLLLSPSDRAIADPIAGVLEWERQAAAGTFRVQKHTPPAGSEMKSVWDSLSDPDGRCAAPTTRIAVNEAVPAELSESEALAEAEMERIEVAEQNASERASSPILLASMLTLAGAANTLAQARPVNVTVTTAAPTPPTPAEMFDALVYPGRPALREAIEQHFEVIAHPRSVLDRDLREGDMLIRKGDTGCGHVSIVARRELRTVETLLAEAMTPETVTPGRYAHVVEGGHRPHTLADNFARRITDFADRVPADQIVLRAK